MCLNGLAALIPAGTRETSSPTAATTLIEHLGLEAKAAAEVEELCSHPFAANEAGTLEISERRIARETFVPAF